MSKMEPLIAPKTRNLFCFSLNSEDSFGTLATLLKSGFHQRIFFKFVSWSGKACGWNGTPMRFRIHRRFLFNFLTEYQGIFDGVENQWISHLCRSEADSILKKGPASLSG